MPLVPLSGPSVSLMETLRAEHISQTDTQQAIDHFLKMCALSTVEDRQLQFDQLLSIVDESAAGPACFLSVVCGALLEQGAKPGRMGEIIHRLLEEIIPVASNLAREYQRHETLAVTGRPTSSTTTPTEKEADESFDRFEVETFERLSQSLPMAREAWDRLGTIWPACVALYSLDVAARLQARTFLPVLRSLMDLHEGAYWLESLLPVLDQEPLVVIDPALQIGITATMTGVADNFQLQTLLMDVFPRRWFERRRVSPSALDVVTGAGPQQSSEQIRGRWNLYTGHAIDHRGQIAPASLLNATHWIWGEGAPSEIPVIDGHRVILLGTPAYIRTWQCSRRFRSLKASIDNIRKIDTTEVGNWLTRLASTPSEKMGGEAKPE